jgi:hypothetical protein
VNAIGPRPSNTHTHRSAYGLTDGDINQLTDVQYKDNPHYLSE